MKKPNVDKSGLRRRSFLGFASAAALVIPVGIGTRRSSKTTSSQELRRNPDVIEREIEDQLVLALPGCIAGSRVQCRLNESGRLIWQALEKPKARPELIDELSTIYRADRSEIQADCDSFLAELQNLGMLV